MRLFCTYESNMSVVLLGNQRQAKQELDVALLLRVLVVKSEPVVKVLEDLVVRLSRDALSWRPFA